MTFEEFAETARLTPAGKALADTAWQQAVQSERERIMKALDAALMLRGGIPSEALLLARAAIEKYEESNDV